MSHLSPAKWRRVIQALALAMLTGCGADITSFANRFTTPAERSFPRSYLQLLADENLDVATSLLAPELRTDTTDRVMRQVAALLKNARLDSMRLIGVNTSNFGNGHDVNLSYEIPNTATGGWVVSNVATRRTGSSVTVIGFSAYPIPDRLEALNRFTLTGKKATHYVWLTLALLMPLVTITVAVVVVRAKGMPRRWLWAFASLIATPAFFINWTTGQVGMQNGLFLLFGGSATSAGPAAPWVVSFAMPLGAGIAYIRLRRWRQATHLGAGLGAGVAA